MNCLVFPMEVKARFIVELLNTLEAEETLCQTGDKKQTTTFPFSGHQIET